MCGASAPQRVRLRDRPLPSLLVMEVHRVPDRVVWVADAAARGQHSTRLLTLGLKLTCVLCAEPEPLSLLAGARNLGVRECSSCLAVGQTSTRIGGVLDAGAWRCVCIRRSALLQHASGAAESTHSVQSHAECALGTAGRSAEQCLGKHFV
jgi:hypothetical protein